MISIIITSFKEPKTIGKAIESITQQDIPIEYELIISAPDKETINVAKEYSKNNKQIKIFQDPGKGKSYALNILFKKLKGEIIILTDGDVYISENSIREILKEFENPEIGCVTGRPVPQESRKTKYGYWANFLFDSANSLRAKLNQQNKFLECSGYLWGFRNNVIKKFPIDVAEDTIIPYLFWEKGYLIGYAQKALVFVKNVNNLKEWLSQKIRTSKAHETLNKYVDTKKTPRTKTFFNESKGVFSLFAYPKNLKEFFWSFQLLFLRLYMWIKVFYDIKIKRVYHEDKWERVSSTK